MKLSEINYDLTSPKEIELLNPITNKSFETPAFISMYSLESKKGKTAQLNIYRELMAKKKETGNNDISDDDLKLITTKHLVGVIAGWRGIQDEKGKEIAFSDKKAIEIMTEYDIVYNLVNSNSSMLGNFIKE